MKPTESTYISSIFNGYEPRESSVRTWLVHSGCITGGYNSKKACFGRKTKFFRESGDFAAGKYHIVSGYCKKKSKVCHFNKEDFLNFREDPKLHSSNNVC